MEETNQLIRGVAKDISCLIGLWAISFYSRDRIQPTINLGFIKLNTNKFLFGISLFANFHAMYRYF